MTRIASIIRTANAIFKKSEIRRQAVRCQSKDVFQSQFGNRHLTDEEKVFERNAWDDVRWDEELLKRAQEKVEMNHVAFMSEAEREELERGAADRWNQFYAKHTQGFFRDRNWLFRVFPDLGKALETANFGESVGNIPGPSTSDFESRRHSGTVNVFEVGCGPGSAVFPMQHNGNCDNLFLYCCDFSQVAIDILKSNDAYDENRCLAFQWDITDTEEELPIEDGTVDFITLLFVLSTIEPSHLTGVIRRLTRLLRPGGRILFRDYGRYDMSQLRLKSGSAIAENFYARGNGTRVYFFTDDEIRNWFTSSTLLEDFIHLDKKLAINRKLRLKMYRVWILAQFRKPG